jgi:chemotaxis response regulator CheB
MIPPIKLSGLIVHHAPLMRLGLSTLIRSGRAFKVVGETGQAPVARGLFAELSPDLVVLSLTLPVR